MVLFATRNCSCGQRGSIACVRLLAGNGRGPGTREDRTHEARRREARRRRPGTDRAAGKAYSPDTCEHIERVRHLRRAAPIPCRPSSPTGASRPNNPRKATRRVMGKLGCPPLEISRGDSALNDSEYRLSAATDSVPSTETASTPPSTPVATVIRKVGQRLQALEATGIIVEEDREKVKLLLEQVFAMAPHPTPTPPRGRPRKRGRDTSPARGSSAPPHSRRHANPTSVNIALAKCVGLSRAYSTNWRTSPSYSRRVPGMALCELGEQCRHGRGLLRACRWPKAENDKTSVARGLPYVA